MNGISSPGIQLYSSFHGGCASSRLTVGLGAACGGLNKQGGEQGQRKAVQEKRIHIGEGDGLTVKGRDKGRHNDQKQTDHCQTQREAAVER